jgi:hypothetical protein
MFAKAFSHKIVIALIAAACLLVVAVVFAFMRSGGSSTLSEIDELQKENPDVSFVADNTSDAAETNGTIISEPGNEPSPVEITAPENGNQASNTDEGSQSSVTAANPNYILKVTPEGNAIALYSTTDLSTSVEEYSFKDKTTPAGESFINQIEFASNDTFLFIGKEMIDNQSTSKLYAFSVDSQEPLFVSGSSVQKWDSVTESQTSYYSYQNDENLSVVLDKNGEEILTLDKPGLRSGFYWDGSEMNYWVQKARNVVTIQNLNGQTVHTDLAQSIDTPVTFLIDGTNNSIDGAYVGTDEGIYFFDGTSDLVFKYGDYTPSLYSVRMNVDKGFVTQQHIKDDTAFSLVFSSLTGKASWTQSSNVTVW